MKILVIEDKEIHQQSARETLKGHDLTIAVSFDAGINAMSASLDYIETFGGPEVNKPFEINGAKALFLHAPFVEKAARQKVWKKDWGRVLKHLLGCE